MKIDLAPPLQQIDRTYVLWRGQKLSYFGGCDYFRLSSHPRIVASVKEGLKNYGLSVSASRVTTGNHPLYEELEGRIAAFFGAPKAVFVTSGYIANLIVAEALAGEFDSVYIDEKAHPSLQTAVRQLGCPVIEFPHLRLKPLRGKRPLIATEGMFGSNGTIAPVIDYLKTGARVWIDDAHGAGTREPVPLPGDAIQTVTFSKAFGVYGGAILCSAALAKKIVSTRIFAGQTPLPLPLAHACLEAMQLLKPGSPLRKRLQKNLEYMGVPTPIIRITAADISLKRRLLQNGIFPSLVRYPGGPLEGYFRFAISSEHTTGRLGELRRLIAV
ncbi:MAG TPA: pyridoxal phosphate-dependent aminotransferase family protein [Verrucomicrobiae bacterium]|nr:pyridoxal phosphate-dependent aminotransferase family protein [Verrucomicrobiae bacterium]